jgi:N-methylhydantoinase B/oxoprolinase/acetone carboxylase alpha subunit
VELRLKGKRYVPPLVTKDEQVRFTAGDTFQARTPGGGGYGKAGKRDRARIEDDLRKGYITSYSAGKARSRGKRKG